MFMVKKDDNVVTWNQVFIIIGVLVATIFIYLVLCWVDIRVVNNHPLRLGLVLTLLLVITGFYLIEEQKGD